MTSTSASPDMRFGSPRRASWLGAIHAGRAQSQHPGPIPPSHSLFTNLLRLSPTSYPTFHPTPQASQPKKSSLSVSVSPITHGILAVLRWPARRRPAVAPQVSAVRVLRGVLPRLGLPSEARVKEEGAFALLRRSANRERDFT